jgi:hypothetical protein
MSDPFKLVPAAESLSQEVSTIRNKLERFNNSLVVADNTNKTNARILDAIREISGKNINKIEIKFFYEESKNYTFSISDPKTMGKILTEIKKWTVYAARSTMSRMRQLTKKKIVRL